VSTSKQQLARLLALVPYLQAREQVHLEQAAGDFGVSVTQLRRDLNVLWFCGYPGLGMGDLIDIDMEAVEGEGVIRLSNAEYLSRPLRLAGTEAAAIMVALRALREGAPPEEAAVVDRTLAKIEAAAGHAMVGDRAVEIRSDEPGDGAVDTMLAALEEALAQHVQVRLDYLSASRDESTSRVVDPIELLDWQGRRYLRAWCHLAEDHRTFRTDRIVSAELLDTPVEQHADAEPLDLDGGMFGSSADAPVATLTLGPEGRWVVEYVPVESVNELSGGGVEVTLRIHSRDWLVRLLSRLGGAVREVEPADLRDDVRDRAKRALENY
jgi:proteasome accessory factor C